MPCFNEERRLDRSLLATAIPRPDSPTFLFVDDGSTDRTRELLEALQQEAGSKCRVIGLRDNMGKAEAVRAGLTEALSGGAERVGYWDADLATPLDMVEVFGRILDDRPDVDVVMGSRVRLLGHWIDRRPVRHYVGRVYATLASLALGLPVYDTQCGAKLFRATPALASALRRPFRSRWAFDVELLMRLQEAWGDSGIGRIVEVPLPEWRDVGESRVSWRGAAGAFLYLLRLLVRGRRRRTPAGPDPADGSGSSPAGAVSAERS